MSSPAKNQILGQRVSQWYDQNEISKEVDFHFIEVNKVLMILPDSVSGEDLKEIFKLVPKMLKTMGSKRGDIKI